MDQENVTTLNIRTRTPDDGQWTGSRQNGPDTDKQGIVHENVNLAFEMDNSVSHSKEKENGVVSALDKTNTEDMNNSFTQYLMKIQYNLVSIYKNNHIIVWSGFYIILGLLYFLYFGYCMYFRFGDEGSIRLLVATVVVVVWLLLRWIYTTFGDKINCFSNIDTATTRKVRKWIRIACYISIPLFAVIYIIVEIALKTPDNLIGLAGLTIFIILFFIFSHNPAKVNWRPVFWGLSLQFIFALLILRWDVGYRIFEWIGDRVYEFLEYTNAGAIFVFGEEYERHYFAFKVLPVIVFTSTVTNILYYLGVMQFVIRHIARFISAVMGTSAAESVNATGNIFLGQSESPLLIRPFLLEMTKSELHAVCTGGFATIAGSVMAAYILYGVPANHLLSASVMSAPAALALAKLFYPETEESKSDSEEVYKMTKGTESNILEAVSNGATQSIKLCANVAVNLIAFVALLEFVNATLKWLGERAGRGLEDGEDSLTFQFICSYVFWPLAFIMGVDSSDCRRVAEMIGIKTFINEFVAYTELSKYIDNQKNITWYESLTNTTNNATGMAYTGTWQWVNGDIVYNDMNITLTNGILSDRSVVISTYALCGFSNLSSIGIMIGALGAMAPSRKSDITSVVLRAMIAGNVACFLTACIAGLLYEGKL